MKEGGEGKAEWGKGERGGKREEEGGREVCMGSVGVPLF